MTMNILHNCYMKGVRPVSIAAH